MTSIFLTLTKLLNTQNTYFAIATNDIHVVAFEGNTFLKSLCRKGSLRVTLFVRGSISFHPELS